MVKAKKSSSDRSEFRSSMEAVSDFWMSEAERLEKEYARLETWGTARIKELAKETHRLGKAQLDAIRYASLLSAKLTLSLSSDFLKLA